MPKNKDLGNIGYIALQFTLLPKTEGMDCWGVVKKQSLKVRVNLFGICKKEEFYLLDI